MQNLLLQAKRGGGAAAPPLSLLKRLSLFPQSCSCRSQYNLPANRSQWIDLRLSYCTAVSAPCRKEAQVCSTLG